ncbi:MAG: DUF1289 domain-containing protein [Bacteroidales bacterium]|nr:DUF1289 domain-containing protein [Bacteroidales bacterium]
MGKDVKSPCINICKYDEDGICMGCYRSMKEITGWLFLNSEDKLKVLENAEKRKKEPRQGINNYEYYI